MTTNDNIAASEVIENIDYGEAIILDENEDTGETLYAVKILTGDVISVIVTENGTEYFNDDWQSYQPKSFSEVGDWRWYRGEEIDF